MSGQAESGPVATAHKHPILLLIHGRRPALLAGQWRRGYAM